MCLDQHHLAVSNHWNDFLYALDLCSFARDDAATRFFSLKLWIEQLWCLVELLFIRVGSWQLCHRRCCNAVFSLTLWIFTPFHKTVFQSFFFEALGLQSFMQDKVAAPIVLQIKHVSIQRQMIVKSTRNALAPFAKSGKRVLRDEHFFGSAKK